MSITDYAEPQQLGRSCRMAMEIEDAGPARGLSRKRL